jgi:RNA polymerase sigma factor (sigma-70 family)
MNRAMPGTRKPERRLEPPELSDADLWRSAVASDPGSFGFLFDRHADRIYTFCIRRTGDREAAEDLTSATFLHAWRRRDDVRFFGESALPWLYGVAANLTRRHLRGSRRHRANLALLVRGGDEPDPADDVARRLDDSLRLHEVVRAIHSLPQPDQEVIALCVWEELSYEQAAVALGVPVGTVRSRLSRARARLRALFVELPLRAGDEGGSAHTSEEGREGR